jgi:DNA polymerase-3 subunit beta
MKFQILQENLERAVGITSRFVSTRTQLPILGNILIATQKNRVCFSSTNLEISASVEVGAKIEEGGEVSVPARVFSELVSNLPKDTITLAAEKESLKVLAPGFNSTILGMNPSDFPKVSGFLGKKKKITLSQKDFAESLSRVLFSTSMDETRPILTGVLFIFEGKHLSLVSTDGFRLSRKTFSIKTGEEKRRVTVPKGVLSEISRAASEDRDVLFSLHEEEKLVFFEADDTLLTSRVLEGEYPDFEKIIPKNSTTKILLDKEEMLRAVKLASIFARESANIVKIKLLEDAVVFLAESGSAGSQETKIDAKIEIYSGGLAEPFEIAFNYRFLEEFLHSVSGEEIKMEFSGVSSPGVFTDPKDSSYLHLIMPVKIQG